MTIVVTGGGSGGHITPILAVARELKKQQPDTRIVYVSHTNDPLDDVPAQDPNIDEIVNVRAGKFRRYHGEGLRQLLDLKTMYLNMRDTVFILIGFWQSFWLLRRVKPSIIFTRGSFVSVPVCLAAAVQGIPYVTHDSDAVPSLTNRLIARWATLHAVALPKELYPYPEAKTETVGVPISSDYVRVTDALRAQYKNAVNLGGFEWVLLLTGGGLGAQRLNDALVANAAFLLSKYPGLAIVHLTGRIHEVAVKRQYKALTPAIDTDRVKVIGFVTNMHEYTGAANVVIARAGATNLAELAVQGKPSIIIPSPVLTGGHQLKNTAVFKRSSAIVEMTEDQIEQELRLGHVVADLFDHPAKTAELSRNFATFGQADAASRIATLLLQKARQK